jgi:hypothetical protein
MHTGHISSISFYNQSLLWLVLLDPPRVVELSEFVLVNIPQNKCVNSHFHRWNRGKDLNSGGSAELEPTASTIVAHQLLSSGASTPITNQRLIDSVLREINLDPPPVPQGKLVGYRPRRGSVSDCKKMQTDKWKI